MNLLLDTHAVLWWLADDPLLGQAARKEIASARNTVFLSAVAVWEMRIKEAIGKLTLPDDFEDVLAAEQFVELPMTSAHAQGVRELPMHHRDPFARLLVAQAKSEGLTLVTADPEIARYDVAILSTA